MATNTPNLNLRKPEAADLVNVLADLAQNYDKIDDIGAPWTAYTPPWFNSGATQPAIGNGTLRGRYKKIGKLLIINIELTVGSTTTFGTAGGFWSFSLPEGISTPSAANGGMTQYGLAAYGDTGVAVYFGNCYISPGSGVINPLVLPAASSSSHAANFVSNTAPHAWGANDTLHISQTLEVA